MTKLNSSPGQFFSHPPGSAYVDGADGTCVCRTCIMRTDIFELLARAATYDEKPHILYSHIRAMALRYADPAVVGKTVELMENEYWRIRPGEPGSSRS
jgi:hypothetical protein